MIGGGSRMLLIRVDHRTERKNGVPGTPIATTVSPNSIHTSIGSYILLAVAITTLHGCGGPSTHGCSSLEGTWQEIGGTRVIWLLGLLPIDVRQRDLRAGKDQPQMIVLREDGSINWAQCRLFDGAPKSGMVQKGDRSTLFEEGDVQLTNADYEPETTRIELTFHESARIAGESITLVAWRKNAGSLIVRYTVRNPLGVLAHYEYRLTFQPRAVPAPSQNVDRPPVDFRDRINGKGNEQ
jgi:hypothetical protein